MCNPSVRSPWARQAHRGPRRRDHERSDQQPEETACMARLLRAPPAGVIPGPAAALDLAAVARSLAALARAARLDRLDVVYDAVHPRDERLVRGRGGKIDACRLDQQVRIVRTAGT